VVAVVGVIRPKLFVARSVLVACSDEELAAILSHEEAHLRRHDNARRLLMASLPDLLTWLPLSQQLNIAWRQAIEEAADNAVGDENSRLRLAEALLRIARMAPPEPLTGNELAASAFYSGAPLELRIRRLMDYAAPETVPQLHRLWSVVISALLCFASVAALRPLHELVEIAVRFLP
jgi:bla regulator protein blaR1